MNCTRGRCRASVGLETDDIPKGENNQSDCQQPLVSHQCRNNRAQGSLFRANRIHHVNQKGQCYPVTKTVKNRKYVLVLVLTVHKSIVFSRQWHCCIEISRNNEFVDRHINASKLRQPYSRRYICRSSYISLADRIQWAKVT